MEVWAWFWERTELLEGGGRERLAELLQSLPHAATTLRHAQVDALAPELLALVRAAEDPWLEIFARHWILQSRVLIRQQGERCLREAVDLVEFAHRPETSSCPQSVCAVQDLSACYGIVDGPGWAPEREAVTAETLARIDETWACFECISSEHASALRDADRPDAALAFLERQRARLSRRPGVDRDALDGFCRTERLEVLTRLGRVDEALDLAALEVHEPLRGLGPRMVLRLHHVRLLLMKGRSDEARAKLPEAREALEAPSAYLLWSDCAARLVGAGLLANDHALGRTLGLMVGRLDRDGAPRSAFLLAERHGALALQRKAAWTARQALARMEACLPRLRAPLGAEALVERLRAAVVEAEAERAVTLPESAEAVLAAIQAEPAEDAPPRRPEDDLPLLDAAARRWPEHEDLLILRSRALAAAGARDEALGSLEAWLDRYPPTRRVVLELSAGSIPEEPERLERLGQKLRDLATPAELLSLPDLARAEHAVRERRWTQALPLLERVCAAQPTAAAPRRSLGQARVRAGDPAGALAELARLEAAAEFTDADHWDRMTAATLLGDLETVRRSARALGLPLPPGEEDGPVLLAGGPIALELPDDEEGRVQADRIGPVTARVSTVVRDGETIYGDVWVFDAEPLEPPSPDAASVPAFEAVGQLSRGGYRLHFVHGAVPGEERLAAFREALWQAGVGVGAVEEADALTDPLTPDARVDGLFLRLVVPPTLRDPALGELLDRSTQSWERPLAWVELAEAIGDPEALAEQQRRAEAYG